MYLHSTPYLIVPDKQTHIPLVMWFSPAFAQDARLKLSCMHHHGDDMSYSHDNSYHSLLGLFDVQSCVYQPELYAFASCRASAQIISPM